MGVPGVLEGDPGSGVHREENQGGSRGTERRGKATGGNFLLPSVPSVPSVVDPSFGASPKAKRIRRDRKGKLGFVFARISGVRARDPGPSSGQRGGPRGRETRRKPNGGRSPLPTLRALCALCGEDQTGRREDGLAGRVRRISAAVGKRRATAGFSRITTEDTGDTERGKKGEVLCLLGVLEGRSRERGSPGGEPWRIMGNGKEGKWPAKISSPLPSMLSVPSVVDQASDSPQRAPGIHGDRK